MSRAWMGWGLLAGAVGLGGAWLFVEREPAVRVPRAAAHRPASSAAAGAPPREQAPPTPDGASASPRTPPTPPAAPVAERVEAAEEVEAWRPGQTLAALEEEHARRRQAFLAAAHEERRPMEHAQPPGPPPERGWAPGSEAPPEEETLRDPEEYRRYMRDRVLARTRAQVAFFERALREQEEKLRRDEAAGMPEEVLIRRRDKLELLTRGLEKFEAKVLLMESRQGP